VVDAIGTMSDSVTRIGSVGPDPALMQLHAMLHRVRVLAADAPATSLSIEDRTDLSRQAQRLANAAAEIASRAPLEGLARLEGGYVVLEMANGSDVQSLLARIEARHADLVAASAQQKAA
jgi:hypothetical protein